MEIILLEDVGVLGNRGARVKVAAGYARNYLIPNRLAVSAAGGGGNIFKEAERQRAVRESRQMKTAHDVARAIEKLNITISMEPGEEDRLFGSVTTADIAAQIAAQGIEVDKRKVILDEPLKQLGVYTVPIKLHTEVEAQVKVWVVKK